MDDFTAKNLDIIIGNFVDRLDNNMVAQVLANKLHDVAVINGFESQATVDVASQSSVVVNIHKNDIELTPIH